MFARPGLCGMGIGRLGLVAASQPSLIAQALAILAKYGSAANLYLPGVGAISGITAGNWLDTVGGTPATVDGAVGTVVNAQGGVNLVQGTSANRPILRLSGGVYSWQFDGSNDHFTTTIPTPNAGYVAGGALCSDTGVLRTINIYSGATTDSVAGVFVAKNAVGTLRISVGNGTTRNTLATQTAPTSTAFVSSAGWGDGVILTGVNNTESMAAKTVDCSTDRVILFGGAGAAFQHLGHLYAQCLIAGALPTAAERATLRQFIASLSGVTM